MKKNRLFAHISKYWFFHILWIVFAVVVTSFEFNLLTKPKKNEKIEIFISANINDDKSFKNYLKENQPDYLREINYRTIASDSMLFGQLFYSCGTNDADLFIVSKENIDSINKSNYFLPLDSSVCETIFGKTLYYYVSEEVNYGIKVNTKYFDLSETEFYILFSKNSLHLGQLSNQQLDGDISITKLFI